MAHHARSRSAVGQAVPGRSTAYWGIAFVLLLLVSAGMVTVPGEQDGVTFVRHFYRDHSTIIVSAQVIGLVAAAVFLGFVRGLQQRDWVGAAPWVLVSGALVAAAAVLAAVPPLVLAAVARSAGDDLVSWVARASDLADVALFVAIAVFATAVTVAVRSTGVRAVSALVGLLSGLHAVLLLAGNDGLVVVAPMAFIVLVLYLSWSSWRRRQPSTPE
jgi:hypothetical protein